MAEHSRLLAVVGGKGVSPFHAAPSQTTALPASIPVKSEPVEPSEKVAALASS
jgi:hypothetical protein